MFVKCVWKYTLRPKVVVLAAVSSLVAPGAVILTPSCAARGDGFVAVVTLWFQVTGFGVHFVFPVYYEYCWDDWNIFENCVRMLSWSHVFIVLRNKEFLIPLYAPSWTMVALCMDHIMKFTLMAPKWKRVGAAGVINHHSRMVRQPAANCPKDSQTTAPSLLLRLQPSLWHWTITDTCRSLLWLNVLFAGNWGWRHQKPLYLSYHEPAMVIEWQGHVCPFLLDTKPPMIKI